MSLITALDINASGLTSLTPEERLFLSNFVPADDGPIKA